MPFLARLSSTGARSFEMPFSPESTTDATLSIIAEESINNRDLNAEVKKSQRLNFQINSDLFGSGTDAKDGRALFHAAKYGLEDVAECCLAAGANMDTIWQRPPFPFCEDLTDLTPLQVALLCKRECMIRFLITNGADVTQRLPRSRASLTPLHIASGLGLADVVRCLLENGARVNALDDHRRTALHCAVEFREPTLKTKKHLEVAKLLMRSGADHDAHNWSFRTPLQASQDSLWQPRSYEYVSIIAKRKVVTLREVSDDEETPLLPTGYAGEYSEVEKEIHALLSGVKAAADEQAEARRERSREGERNGVE